ncbi:MAG: TonB-dependent hemoglobin/transferrin/lactoferrin family receptor [Alphaproteobacteria bacterium]
MALVGSSTRRAAFARLVGGSALALLCTADTAAAQQTAAQQPTAREATAQAATAATELPPITVATPAPPATDAATTRVDKAERDHHMVDDIGDIGRRIDAGLNFSRRTRSIALRGLDASRVLTTIDGIRQTWMEDPRSVRGGVSAFDFETLSTVDIIRGADSSRYGSGALGGVVALRTLDPEDLLPGGRAFGGLAKTGYDSADDSWRVNAATAGRMNDTYLLLEGGFRRGHELETRGDVGGTGPMRTKANPADYDQYNFLAKLHRHFDGGHRLGLTGELFNRDEETDNRRGQTGTYRVGQYDTGEETDRKRASIAYDFKSPAGDDLLDVANLTAYWQRQTLNNTIDAVRDPDGRAFIIPGDPFRYGFPSGVFKRDNELKQTSYGLQGDMRKLIDAGATTHGLSFGGEIYRQETTQYSAGTDNCPDVDWTTVAQPFGPQTCRMIHSNAADMPDVKSLAFGLFAQDEIGFAEGLFSLTPGLRYDWYRHRPKATAEYVRGPNFDGPVPDSASDSKLSPKLRATWHATPELDVFVQWAQGFRAPTASELYQNFGAPGSYARVGNPGLKAETSNGFEAGVRYAGKEVGVSVTVFDNHYRDFIDQMQVAPPGGDYPVGGIIGYENRARVRIYGAEAAGHWDFKSGWRVRASVAWAVGRDTKRDEYVNSVPPLRGILGLGYAEAEWGGDVSLTAAAARDDVAGDGFKAQSYGIVDVTAWWEPGFLKGLRVQGGVFNLFDKKYWNALDVPDGVVSSQKDFYSEPGRSVRLAVSHRF